MMPKPVRSIPPDFDRFVKVMRREVEPDRVHFIELGIDTTIFHQYLSAVGEPVPSQWPTDLRTHWELEARFYQLAGYDYLRPSLELGFFNPNRTIVDDTADAARKRAWACDGVGSLNTWEAFEKYPWPTPSELDFSKLEWSLQHLPDGMGIVQMIGGGVFEWTSELMGVEGLCMALFDQPELVEAVVEKVGQQILAGVRLALQRGGIGVVFLGDDMGYKGATLISPDDLRRLILPWHQQIARACHEAGALYFMHSCGNLSALMDDLINTVGIDAKHSFEDVIMPVEEACKCWGKQVGILGGVDMNILSQGPPERVRQRTRQILEACLPCGAYALGSGNTLANYVLFENYLAMLEEGVYYYGK